MSEKFMAEKEEKTDFMSYMSYASLEYDDFYRHYGMSYKETGIFKGFEYGLLANSRKQKTLFRLHCQSPSGICMPPK
jgi:hypothetical protein